jgi:spore maturation protein CgeB
MVLNINRADMAATGYSPPTRVFEAAGCACCIVTDAWEGIDSFFSPDVDLLVAHTAEEIARQLRSTSREQARRIGWSARKRVLRDHTYAQRAAGLERALAREPVAR